MVTTLPHFSVYVVKYKRIVVLDKKESVRQGAKKLENTKLPMLNKYGEFLCAICTLSQS